MEPSLGGVAQEGAGSERLKVLGGEKGVEGEVGEEALGGVLGDLGGGEALAEEVFGGLVGEAGEVDGGVGEAVREGAGQGFEKGLGPEILVDAEDEAGPAGEVAPLIEELGEAERFAAAAVEGVEVVEEENERAGGGGEAAEFAQGLLVGGVVRGGGLEEVESSKSRADRGGGLLEGPSEGVQPQGVARGTRLGVGAKSAPPEGRGGLAEANFGAEELNGRRQQLLEMLLEPSGYGLVGVGEIKEGEGAGFQGGEGGDRLGAGEVAGANQGGHGPGKSAAGYLVQRAEAGIGGGLVEGCQGLVEEGFPGQGLVGVEGEGDKGGRGAGGGAPLVEQLGFSKAGAGGFEEDDAAAVEAHGVGRGELGLVQEGVELGLGLPV